MCVQRPASSPPQPHCLYMWWVELLFGHQNQLHLARFALRTTSIRKLHDDCVNAIRAQNEYSYMSAYVCMCVFTSPWISALHTSTHLLLQARYPIPNGISVNRMHCCQQLFGSPTNGAISRGRLLREVTLALLSTTVWSSGTHAHVYMYVCFTTLFRIYNQQ
jgi:hypothetical protein